MNSKFELIKTLIKTEQLVVQDTFLTSKNLPPHEFTELFPTSSYPSADFEVQTGTGTVNVNDLDFIFDSYYDLFKEVAGKNKNPISSEVIILPDKREFVDLGDFAEFYRLWIELLEKVSEHQYLLDSSEINRAYIFVHKESLNLSSVLNIELNQVNGDELAALITSISNPKLLLESCLQEDAHQLEKLSMMKTSIVELIDKHGFSFLELFASAENLLNTFHKNYETYLRSFSFEEFIKDLEDDVGNFISKVEEQIQGFYVQALAVPGAVILASALRGAEKNISLALIFSTVLALILVFRSLKSKTVFITRITTNTLTKLTIYQRRTVDIANAFAKDTITEKIEAAVSSVNRTSEESKKEICELGDIIIGLLAIYTISAIVFWKL
jgi:hypothetical protein